MADVRSDVLRFWGVDILSMNDGAFAMSLFERIQDVAPVDPEGGLRCSIYRHYRDREQFQDDLVIVREEDLVSMDEIDEDEEPLEG